MLFKNFKFFQADSLDFEEFLKCCDPTAVFSSEGDESFGYDRAYSFNLLQLLAFRTAEATVPVKGLFEGLRASRLFRGAVA